MFDTADLSTDGQQMGLPRHGRLVAALSLGLVASSPACRRGPAPAPPATGAPSERDGLLERIRALDEVGPCLVDGGAVRLVDAELAGEAATATFACANGAASGKVTFFRVGGTWTVSTKELVARSAPTQPR